MKIILLILLALSPLVVGCITSLPTIERPYERIFEEGKFVKRTMRFPDLCWYHLPAESCISRPEIIDLNIYIIQLNNLIDEYEEIVGIKEEDE